MHLGSQCRERAYRLTCRFCSIMKYLELHWACTQTQSHLLVALWQYGKWYAMEETTLLTSNFLEGVTSSEELSEKRKLWSLFFSICHPERTGETILLYRTEYDIEKNLEKTLTAGEVCSFMHVEMIIAIRKQPLIKNPSPLVLPATQATLENIDMGKYTFWSERVACASGAN